MPSCAASRKRFYLYGARTTLGWRVVRMVSQEKGYAMEARGVWRRVHESGSGQLIGFQLMSTELTRGDEDILSVHSAAAISRSEMGVVAGTAFHDGTSRTYRLDEPRRIERMLRGRPPEDRIERVQA